MKKLFYFAAVAAAVLTSCAKTHDTHQYTGAGDAVSFSVYAGKTPTKAVSEAYFGNITTTELKLTTAGFGVFGYYTDNDSYAEDTFAADFMYNEKVTWNSTSSKWEYSPIKYWPNEHGTSATSTDADKLTFLCYAPYVAQLAIGSGELTTTVDDGTGTAATEGITRMTGNTIGTSAKLRFTVPASSEEQIDLLYGVLKSKSVNVDGVEEGNVDTTTDPETHDPIENLTKQKTGGKVDILFKHALAKATIDIRDIVDQENASSALTPGSDDTDGYDGTVVVVKDLNILGGTSTKVFGTSGVLNLYTGVWSSITGTSSFAVAPLPTEIAVNSKPTAQPTIEGVLEGGLEDAGYTTAPGKIDIMFIPGGDIVGVEIIYYVCTEDDKLGFNGGASIIENHITKYFDMDGTEDGNQPIATEAGKQYNINIQLGLTSVKLQADVDPWDDDDYPIDLPKNVS